MKAPARCPASPPLNFSSRSRCCPSPPSALPLQLKPSFSSLFPLCSTLPSSKLCARPSSPQAPSSSPSAEPPASPLSSPPSSTATCSLALPAVCGPASSSASSPSTTPLTPTAPCVMLPSRAALALPPISSTVLPSACSLPLCPFLPSFLPPPPPCAFPSSLPPSTVSPSWHGRPRHALHPRHRPHHQRIRPHQ